MPRTGCFKIVCNINVIAIKVCRTLKDVNFWDYPFPRSPSAAEDKSNLHDWFTYFRRFLWTCRPQSCDWWSSMTKCRLTKDKWLGDLIHIECASLSYRKFFIWCGFSFMFFFLQQRMNKDKNVDIVVQRKRNKDRGNRVLRCTDTENVA